MSTEYCAKRGRPPKDQNEARVYNVKVRLSKIEKDYLDQIVEETGMSKSRIMRAMIRKWDIEMGLK